VLQGFVNGDSSTAQECTTFDGTGPPPTVVDYRGSSGSIYNLLRRVSEVDIIATVNTPPGQYFNSQTSNSVDFNNAFNNSRAVDKYASIFGWWTGSRRHKQYFRDFGTVETLSVTLSNPVKGQGISDDFRYKPEFGQHATEAIVWPILEFEIPFINRFIASQTFLNRTQSEPYVDNPLEVFLHDSTGMDVPEPTRHFETIGDDFQFFFALPPPNILDPLIKEGKQQFVPPPLEDIAFCQSWYTVSSSWENRSMTTPLASILVNDLNAFTQGSNITGLSMSCTLDYDGGPSDSDIFGLLIGVTPFTGTWTTNATTNRIRMELFDFSFSEPVLPNENLTLQLDIGTGTITGTFTVNFRVGDSPPVVLNNVTLAGFTAENPLWISEARPSQEVPPPGQDEIVITATQLTEPVWVSRVKPPEGVLEGRKSLHSQPKRGGRRRCPSSIEENLIRSQSRRKDNK
jgi:hypothetical protein